MFRSALPALALLLATPAAAQPAPPPLSTADFVDLGLDAPVVAEATIRRVTRLREPASAPGLERAYVEADLTAVVRAPRSLQPRQGWVWEGPAAERRALKGQHVLVFARPLPDRPGLLQLIAADAQRPSSPDQLAAVRALLADAQAPDAAPAITGVTRSFHTAGALPGEGETQLFLATADDRPVSLSIRRSRGREPTWSFATGDVVGAARPAVRRDTLTWARLACGLPATLPVDALPADAEGAEAVRRDYRLVLDSLGACGRTRGLPTG